MSSALDVVPEEQTVKTGVRNPDAVSGGLADVLSDTYALILKTHACHWNVEGPLFFSVHTLTEEQYTDMFDAADDLAERIRALGRLAPMHIPTIIETSVVNDFPPSPSAGQMCSALAEDHQRIAKRLHALIVVAEEENDAVTADLATARSAFHEKAAWMLRALAAD